ncbi:protein THEM6-like [Chanos chanos]|uniref:Protein THEM6 n=1 Tax=Chanos chanos TaxID=29144 RepID=A0A6J2VF05_CHACN|nr:protein THEM6-like [Chanos chanos]
MSTQISVINIRDKCLEERQPTDLGLSGSAYRPSHAEKPLEVDHGGQYLPNRISLFSIAVLRELNTCPADYIFLPYAILLFVCSITHPFLCYRDVLLWVLGVLLLLFSSLDVWYYLRAVLVVIRAWFLKPVWDVLAEQSMDGRVLLHDVDLCHMNNARYLRECDFARYSLYTRNGVFKATRALGATMVVGATTIRYRRALCVGESFELRSRIISWDDKSFYLEQRFVSRKDGLVSAVMYCKQNVLRSSPDKIMQFLCKRKVETPEYPQDLQHWIDFISASSQALRSESGLEEKNK